MRTALTPEVAERLIKACPRFLHHNQVALSCGVAPSDLQHWLVLGITEPGEPYCSFAQAYYEADMAYCERETRALFDEDGDPTLLRLRWEWHRQRWPATEQEASILPLSETKGAKRRSMVEALRNPTPELAQIEAEAGLVHSDRVAAALAGVELPAMALALLKEAGVAPIVRDDSR